MRAIKGVLFAFSGANFEGNWYSKDRACVPEPGLMVWTHVPKLGVCINIMPNTFKEPIHSNKQVGLARDKANSKVDWRRCLRWLQPQRPALPRRTSAPTLTGQAESSASLPAARSGAFSC